MYSLNPPLVSPEPSWTSRYPTTTPQLLPAGEAQGPLPKAARLQTRDTSLMIIFTWMELSGRIDTGDPSARTSPQLKFVVTMQGSKLVLPLAHDLNRFALQVGSELTRTALTDIPVAGELIVIFPTPVPGSPLIENPGTCTV